MKVFATENKSQPLFYFHAGYKGLMDNLKTSCHVPTNLKLLAQTKELLSSSVTGKFKFLPHTMIDALIVLLWLFQSVPVYRNENICNFLLVPVCKVDLRFSKCIG